MLEKLTISGSEGNAVVKRELGFAYFLLGKWDFGNEG